MPLLLKVQRLMRGLEVGEAYHATLEVKTAEERVLKVRDAMLPHVYCP